MSLWILFKKGILFQQTKCYIVEAKLTNISTFYLKDFVNKGRKENVLPNYNRILNEKKKIYTISESVQVTESKAEISLQGLLDHTTARIVAAQKEVGQMLPAQSEGDLVLNILYTYNILFNSLKP